MLEDGEPRPKVLQIRSVRFVGSALPACRCTAVVVQRFTGTWWFLRAGEEELSVSGVTYNRNEAKIACAEWRDRARVAGAGVLAARAGRRGGPT